MELVSDRVVTGRGLHFIAVLDALSISYLLRADAHKVRAF